MQYSLTDYRFMSHAIRLAKNGQYTTSPNPNVGCVIVKNNQIIGQGWHKKAGTGHAEVNALADLTIEQSTGATAYVTLEPCSHYGRTPPCAKRLIEAGVKTVFVAMLDTNPQVSGNGVKLLQEADIEVNVGLLEQDARALNLDFFKRMEQKRPFVQVKMASSIDGKVALSNGDSQWITGQQARSDVQRFRSLACAILSTSKTILADDAKLNVRESNLNYSYPIDETNEFLRQPTRIILDSKNDLTHKHIDKLALFLTESPIVLVRKYTTGEFDHIDWINEVIIEHNQGFDLNKLLEWCATQEINTLWVEAGSSLAASFVAQSLFDELIVYMAPKLMGANAQELMPIGPFSDMNKTVNLSLTNLTQVGNDIRFIYQPIKQ